jgi:hypothetical protein
MVDGGTRRSGCAATAVLAAMAKPVSHARLPFVAWDCP